MSVRLTERIANVVKHVARKRVQIIIQVIWNLKRVRRLVRRVINGQIVTGWHQVRQP